MIDEGYSCGNLVSNPMNVVRILNKLDGSLTSGVAQAKPIGSHVLNISGKNEQSAEHDEHGLFAVQFIRDFSRSLFDHLPRLGFDKFILFDVRGDEARSPRA